MTVLDLQSLDSLEHKIQRAVTLVSRLREEKRALEATVKDLELQAAQKQVLEAKLRQLEAQAGDAPALHARVAQLEGQLAEQAAQARELESMKLGHEQLERELQALQDERQTVLARVDGLLENLDKLEID